MATLDKRLLAAGLGSLAIGTAIYVFMRPAGTTQFLPAAMGRAGVVAGATWLGSVPTLTHVLAFALLSAALVQNTRTRLFWCALWPAIDVAFEIGQSPAIRGRIADADPVSWMPFLSGYLGRGTFDWWDVGAAALGGICAAGLVVGTTSRGTRS
jgi:hypothetical protein